VILVDTSIWISLLRDQGGNVVEAFRQRVGSEAYVLTRFNQLELLQGAKDSREWRVLEDYLDTQFYLEASTRTWTEAARIYFDLRRKGLTINSPVDCCIAQVAIENGALLLHCDNDFKLVAEVRRLDEEYFRWQ